MQRKRTSVPKRAKRSSGRATPGKSAAVKSKKPDPTKRSLATAKRRGKVGSNPGTAREFGSSRDFGIPSGKARPSGRSKDAGEGMPRNWGGRSVGSGERVEGVGTSGGGPGAGSGGDLDTSFIGLDGRGLAQDAPTAVTEGPASSTGGSEEFASGPPAPGENQTPRVRDRRVRGTTFDRSGGDTSSGNQNEQVEGR